LAPKSIIGTRANPTSYAHSIISDPEIFLRQPRNTPKKIDAGSSNTFETSKPPIIQMSVLASSFFPEKIDLVYSEDPK